MTDRNLSPYVYFERLAASHKPRHAFKGTTKAQFSTWKRTLAPKVLATLGDWPKKVPPHPQLLAEWSEHGLIKQRWVIDVQPGLAAVLLVFRPEDMAPREKRPAILCCHGHGQFGKDSPMGIASDDDRAAEIKRFNYDYGLQMARDGFVTYALDWLGFGERASDRKPNNVAPERRDKCNIHYLCATMLGTTILAMNCHDAARATDFVCTLPFVDPKRLGVMGLSLGGTMTTWVMLTDPRFTAADMICYFGPFYDIAYRTYNVCGSQVTPRLFELCDTPDLHGLIAPKPLLVEVGVHDDCFKIDHSLNKHYRQLQRIYKAAGAADKLELDLFPGNHAWGANKSTAFFRNALGFDG